MAILQAGMMELHTIYDPLAPFELQRHSDANTRMKKPRALECQRPLFLVPADPRKHNTLVRTF